MTTLRLSSGHCGTQDAAQGQILIRQATRLDSKGPQTDQDDLLRPAALEGVEDVGSGLAAALGLQGPLAVDDVADAEGADGLEEADAVHYVEMRCEVPSHHQGG